MTKYYNILRLLTGNYCAQLVWNRNTDDDAHMSGYFSEGGGLFDFHEGNPGLRLQAIS
ncbi:hypothetical protein TcasGA2_TC002910 [Tribolium castaneum]|uniref:Uncharacterized protein n=1 Tax=Tribolium castaneum TaxID=7070 RepID=D6WHG1_TRICA|nr:hypothetical protein TcasGA2_TC002910 [Tribolium castaneum]